MSAIMVPDWNTTRASVRDVAPRVASLLRSIRQPDAVALGSWTVNEVATHLSHVYDVVLGLATGSKSPITDLWDLSGYTVDRVSEDQERDLGALADRVEMDSLRLLDLLPDRASNSLCPWLVEGVEVPMSMLCCHLLNESLVHGYDIARADGQTWTIRSEDAAVVLLGFIVPVLQLFDGYTFVNAEVAEGLQAVFKVRLRRGLGEVCFRFDDGRLTLESPSQRRVDCTLSADATAFLLIVWGRQTQWRAIAAGKIMASGRRPWLGLRFRSLVRNP